MLGIDNPDLVVSLGKAEEKSTVEEMKKMVLPEVATKIVNEVDKKIDENPINMIAIYAKAAQNPIVPEGKEIVKSKLYDVSYSNLQN